MEITITEQEFIETIARAKERPIEDVVLQEGREFEVWMKGGIVPEYNVFGVKKLAIKSIILDCLYETFRGGR